MKGLPVLTCAIDREELKAAIEFLDDYRKALDLDTDGLVIKLSSLEAQRDFGEGTRSPKWAGAYKFPPEMKETRLLDVVVQVGKTGQITPVAQLEPVGLGGTVVQRASLCNQDELNRLGIDIGDYVKVQRSGEVIPKIVGLGRPSPTKQDVNKSYQLPKTCPCCSTPLERPESMVHFYCFNTDCRDQVFARLVYAVGKDALDIDGCGEGMVQLLMDKAAVRQLSDMYALADLTILKPAARKKLQDGLEKAKQAPLWRKLAALNIEGVGKVSCQDLGVKYDNLEAMIDDQAGIVELLGEIAATALRSAIFTNIEELERLKGFGFNFIEDRKAAGPLSGKTFVITGTLTSGRRDDVSALIESKGGVVKGTVTRNVDFLVQGIGGGSNKAAGAAKWGTRMISEEELYQMIGIAMPTAAQRGAGDACYPVAGVA
jgi:DNA ligase (NAD+)